MTVSPQDGVDGQLLYLAARYCTGHKCVIVHPSSWVAVSYFTCLSKTRSCAIKL